MPCFLEKRGNVDLEVEKEVEKFLNNIEKNIPTNPSKWSYYKSQAKKLKTWIHREFDQDKQLNLFNSFVFPWLSLDDELDLVEFG